MRVLFVFSVGLPGGSVGAYLGHKGEQIGRRYIEQRLA
jgi:hypothetical protein